MNELQLIPLEQNDISSWDFQQIKTELENALSVYKNSVYTDETIKSAKEDKAKLAKAKKLVEDKRKEYKEKCLAPYSAIEPQVKELVTMIEEQRQQIDEVVKDYTERQKQEKEKEIKAYFDKKSGPLGKYAQKLYERILDPKWLNASTKKTQYQEEIQTAINKAVSDLQAIEAMKSPFVETVFEKYTESLSLDEAKAKHEELVTAAEKAGLNKEPAASAPESKPVFTTQMPVDAENGTLVRIYADKSKLNQILDFAQAIGARYEIQ